MESEDLEKLDELLDVEDGLTLWEVEFLESLNQRRDRPISEKQVSILDRIWLKATGQSEGER